MIYVRNSMPRVLGTAHLVDVEMLTWDLVAPQAEKTQAIKRKDVYDVNDFILVMLDAAGNKTGVELSRTYFVP